MRGQPVLAGVVTALVGFTGAFAVVLSGLRAAGADQRQAASGLLVLCVAVGLVSVVLGLRYRMPISIAWSTPGAALLIAAGPPAGGFPAAVGAFLLCGALVVVAGLVTPLGRAIAAIPSPVAAAMLAGVLLDLCLAPVRALAEVPLLTAPVIGVWAVVGRFARPWAVPAALVVAAAMIATTGLGVTAAAAGGLAPVLVWTTPVFDPATLVSVGLPLFLVTMAAQNVPGMAVLAQFGYRPPLRPILLGTGLATVAGAAFGGHAVNLAAISAALAAGPDAGPDPRRRWVASVTAGIGTAVLGLAAGVVTVALLVSPPALVTAVAGLALLGALGAAIAAAVADPDRREAAAVTFVVTAAGTGFLGVSAAFWGLLAGAAMTVLHRRPTRHPAVGPVAAAPETEVSSAQGVLNTREGADVTEPEITGPVPGAATLAGAAPAPPAGYLEEEFFLAGTATAYRAQDEPGPDGRWQVEPADTAAFTTRLLVRRPADPQRHNGAVVVEWLNVSAGADAGPEWSLTHRHLTRDGFAWVGVSAQRVGVVGGAAGALGQPLSAADPQRYGSLAHPGDAWSFDVFTQAARAVRSGAGGLLGPLRAERLLAAGMSQSAAYLSTYLNAVAPRGSAFDGYLVHSRGGGVPPLTGLPIGADGAVDFSLMRTGGTRIRDDLAVPVLVLETETDLIGLGYTGARQPDTDLLRLWELAGAAHADTYLLASGLHTDDTTVEQLAQLCAPTTTPFGPMARTEIPINAGPQHHYVAQAALAHLDRWVREGTPAPVAPRLDLAGDPPGLVADDLGIARGGIRTGFVDVPTSALSGLGQEGAAFVALFGTTRAFDPATLGRLYPGGRDEYAKHFADATAQAVADGFVLAADADEMTALAVAMYPT